MNIRILVEPVDGKFQATTGRPLDLSADGASGEEAVEGLRAKINRRLSMGAVLIEERFPDPDPAFARTSLADNPMYEDFLAAVEEYRNQCDAEDRVATGDDGQETSWAAGRRSPTREARATPAN